VYRHALFGLISQSAIVIRGGKGHSHTSHTIQISNQIRFWLSLSQLYFNQFSNNLWS